LFGPFDLESGDEIGVSESSGTPVLVVPNEEAAKGEEVVYDGSTRGAMCPRGGVKGVEELDHEGGGSLVVLVEGIGAVLEKEIAESGTVCDKEWSPVVAALGVGVGACVQEQTCDAVFLLKPDDFDVEERGGESSGVLGVVGMEPEFESAWQDGSEFALDAECKGIHVANKKRVVFDEEVRGLDEGGGECVLVVDVGVFPGVEVLVVEGVDVESGLEEQTQTEELRLGHIVLDDVEGGVDPFAVDEIHIGAELNEMVHPCRLMDDVRPGKEVFVLMKMLEDAKYKVVVGVFLGLVELHDQVVHVHPLE
jgi:hypothetical protein